MRVGHVGAAWGGARMDFVVGDAVDNGDFVAGGKADKNYRKICRDCDTYRGLFGLHF